MSNIPLPDNAGRVDTFTRQEGADTVHMQAVVPVDPATGLPPRYVKLYNKASAPTVGTDVPVLTIPVPAGGPVNLPFGATGHRFATGIALAITANAADSDTTAVGASEVKVATAYI